jgi:enoyl-CoA hydratase
MSDTTAEISYIRYDVIENGIARIVLNRPETRNAQSVRFLYELNDAFDRAAQDDDIRVVILAAEGPDFSSGHDLRESDKASAMTRYETVGTWCGFGCPGVEGQMAREKEIYLGFSERWRNLPKPTIAEVQGRVIAGGLMLVWPCDLIVAADDAKFADNTIAMGISGVEFFNHVWEVGVRRAKELLFTTRYLTAAEAERAGMVNHVVPRAELASFTLQLAREISKQPLFALRLAKEAVNSAQDAQGRTTAMQTAFALHQLCHSHNISSYSSVVHPDFVNKGWKAPELPTSSASRGITAG